jgi:FeS assembly SUF system regulator
MRNYKQYWIGTVYAPLMIRLNKLTDYAVVVLVQMASDDRRMMTAPRIAEGTGVPLPTVAKLLKILARDGLVRSQRGAGGGYVLGRRAADITVADIVSSVEGPIALTACVDGAEGGCEVELMCPMRGNWDRVNGAIRNALSEVSLADMAASFVAFLPAEKHAGLRPPRAAAPA